MTPATATAYDYGLITTLAEFDQVHARVLADAQAGKPFGFDIETSYEGETRVEAALHPEENFICGFSLTSALTWARYVPVRHDSGTNLPPRECARLLWVLLATGMGVAHGAKFELRCLSRWFMEHLADDPELGPAVRASRGYFPVRSCTLLESYAEGKNRSHGLKEATKANFGHEMTALLDLFPGGLTKQQQKSIRFSGLDQHDPKVYRYACEDSLWSLAHHLRRYPAVLASRQAFIYKMEMSVLPITCAMEDEGILYDWNLLREGAVRGREFKDRLAVEISNRLTALIRENDPDAPPVKINLASPAQVAKVLYQDLKMPQRRKTKKGGGPSTDKVALKALSEQFPVVKEIQNWKQLTKLIGTYLDVYERSFSYAADGRTHPSWIQHGVPAGRYACKGPPTQQSPKVYHYTLKASGWTYDLNFRNAITAPDGWYILGFDLAQQELRVIAGEAQEQSMIDAFRRGIDVHKLTASLMLGKPLAEVTAEDRKLGKTLGLALVYQLGVEGLAERLGVSKDAAEELYNQFFAAYPAIKTYNERIVAAARAQGYLVTHFGRRVAIWEYESGERYMMSQGDRTAGNVPIQGPGTGDYPKIAMVRADKALRAAGLHDSVRLFLNMHDALEYYVRRDVRPADVIAVLEPAVVFPVPGWPPLRAEWHAGLRWGSVSELEWDGTNVRRVAAEAPEPVLEEEPDEDGPALPAIDLSVLQAAATRQPGAGGDGPAVAAGPASDNGAEPRQVLITATRMPTAGQFQRLQRLLALVPGRNPVTLRTPEGSVSLGTTGFGPEAGEPVMEALADPGARVTCELTDEDRAQMAAGL